MSRRPLESTVMFLVLTLYIVAFQVNIASQRGGSRDPGVRGGLPGAGQPIAGLTAREMEFFTWGRRISRKKKMCPMAWGRG